MHRLAFWNVDANARQFLSEKQEQGVKIAQLVHSRPFRFFGAKRKTHDCCVACIQKFPNSVAWFAFVRDTER